VNTVHPDTFDSLRSVITEGFSSQASVSKRIGPNARIGYDSIPSEKEKSVKTGDSYTVVLKAAKIARTSDSFRTEAPEFSVPEPMIIRPNQNLIFVDKTPANQIEVIIHTSNETHDKNEALYAELFRSVAPDMEFSYRYE
jgi:hypothetical protein